MDWGAVTPAELLASLREADWRRAAARSWLEVLGRMNIPRNQARWQARLKANTYYYRVNYAHVAAALVALSLLRRPPARGRRLAPLRRRRARGHPRLWPRLAALAEP
jgi:hypothetical protein